MLFRSELILSRYPKRVDHVIQLTVSETIPEPKMLSFLEYLCNASLDTLVAILQRLTEWASTAGMELLRYMYM